MERNLSLRSIHDVLTDREPLSDPTETLDRNGVALVVRKKDPSVRAAVQETKPANLKLVSVHDVLTSRQENSDPTEHDK